MILFLIAGTLDIQSGITHFGDGISYVIGRDPPVLSTVDHKNGKVSCRVKECLFFRASHDGGDIDKP